MFPHLVKLIVIFSLLYPRTIKLTYNLLHSTWNAWFWFQEISTELSFWLLVFFEWLSLSSASVRSCKESDGWFPQTMQPRLYSTSFSRSILSAVWSSVFNALPLRQNHIHSFSQSSVATLLQRQQLLVWEIISKVMHQKRRSWRADWSCGKSISVFERGLGTCSGQAIVCRHPQLTSCSPLSTFVSFRPHYRLVSLFYLSLSRRVTSWRCVDEAYWREISSVSAV